MGSRFVRSAQVVFLACLVTGCAVRSEIKKEDLTTLKGDIRFDCVLVKDYTALPTITALPMTLTTAQDSTIEYLRIKDIFREVCKPRECVSLKNCAVVEANLLDIRQVNRVGRLYGGAMVGRSHMKMKVKITDAATGATIAEQELIGAPNAWASAFTRGGTDRELPAAMGAFIGEFVLGHSRK
jgi:hypothetical protein